LYIINADTGDILRKVEFESPLPQLDQAFSPVFSSNGKVIYFSAAKNITRDIYSIELESGKVVNLTNDSRFDTAPAVSPDGAQLAYIGQDGDFQHLFVLDLATGYKSRFNDGSPSWSEDGAKLVYVSDVKDNIWNLYTLDLRTMISEQWTEFGGQVLTPVFVKGQPNKVYFTVFWDEDEFRSYIYPNFEIFEATLKQPISRQVFANMSESTEYSFQPYRSLFNYELDKNQLVNSVKPKERWQLTTDDIYVGTSSFYGFFESGYFEAANMLGTKRHLFQFVSFSDFFRIFDYSYVNAENRWAKAYGASYEKLPLRYLFYDLVNGSPRQIVLTNTLSTEYAAGLFALYPLNKFNRWEIYSKVRHREYNLLGLTEDVLKAFNDIFPGSVENKEIQASRFFGKSNGSSLVFGGAYVRDTVIYSQSARGPYHGNALRVQVEMAPPVGNVFKGYVSFSANARMYKGLSSGGGTVFAVRADMLENTRANGEFLLLGGPDMLRGVTYGSLMGNRVAYVSAELRFPLVDAVVFPDGFGIGPFRGLAFFDAGRAGFSGDNSPFQKGSSIGAGVQFSPFSLLWTRRSNGKWVPTFYYRLDW